MRRLAWLLPLVLAAQVPAPQPKPAAATKAASAPKPVATAPKPAAAKPKPTARPATSAKPAPPAPAPLTDEQKAVYSLGLTIHKSLGRFDLSAAEMDLVKRAMTDAAAGKPAVDLKEWGHSIETFGRVRAERVVEKEKAAGKAYSEKAAARPGAVRTESGIVILETQAGTGASPGAADTVRVHYRGALIDGTEFDSSYARNEPAQFSLGGVIKCWTEGVQKMKTGGKATLVCPADMAYGDRGRPTIPGGATLVFDIELLAVVGGNP